VTPHIFAAKNRAGCIPGVHKITSLQPAICAGIASIRIVEKSGAVPPGM
jgi:hypothetical protein